MGAGLPPARGTNCPGRGVRAARERADGKRRSIAPRAERGRARQAQKRRRPLRDGSRDRGAGGARRAPPGGLRPKRSRRRPAKICDSHCHVCVERISRTAAPGKPRRRCEALPRAGATQRDWAHGLRSDAPAAVAENTHLEPTGCAPSAEPGSPTSGGWTPMFHTLGVKHSATGARIQLCGPNARTRENMAQCQQRSTPKPRLVSAGRRRPTPVHRGGGGCCTHAVGPVQGTRRPRRAALQPGPPTAKQSQGPKLFLRPVVKIGVPHGRALLRAPRTHVRPNHAHFWYSARFAGFPTPAYWLRRHLRAFR